MEVREPAIAYGKRKLTIEEYLEMEDASDDKHEYFQGEIFDMTGTKMPHNETTANLFYQLKGNLRGKPCKPYGNNTRVHIEMNTLFTYPDITIICGEPITRNNDNLNVLNPAVLIEVLSTSRRNYDRVTKFGLYKDIPSLKSYIVVDSLAVSIEVHTLNNSGEWTLSEYKTLDDQLEITAIGVTIALEDIYEDVKFT